MKDKDDIEQNNIGNPITFRYLDEAELAKKAGQLQLALAENTRFLVAYEIPTTNTKFESLLHKDNLNATNIMKAYLKNDSLDVNISNNYGMTILHWLAFLDRFDLFQMVVDSGKFEKINYKCCLPSHNGSFYFSAIDVCLMGYMNSAPGATLELITTLLDQGATPPNPDKKFIDNDILAEFYPPIVLHNDELLIEEDEEEEQTLSFPQRSELIELYVLLMGYGFAFDNMIKHFEKKLFEEDHWTEFNHSYKEVLKPDVKLTQRQHKERLNQFKNEVQAEWKKRQFDEYKVGATMTAIRSSDGKDSLHLPFDPQGAPVCVMF